MMREMALPVTGRLHARTTSMGEESKERMAWMVLQLAVVLVGVKWCQ